MTTVIALMPKAIKIRCTAAFIGRCSHLKLVAHSFSDWEIWNGIFNSEGMDTSNTARPARKRLMWQLNVKKNMTCIKLKPQDRKKIQFLCGMTLEADDSSSISVTTPLVLCMSTAGINAWFNGRCSWDSLDAVLYNPKNTCFWGRERILRNSRWCPVIT